MRFFYLLLTLILFSSCDELFEYHPNQIILREDEQNLTRKALDRLAMKRPGDTIRFVLMGDTQRFYDHVADFTKHVTALHERQPIDFVLHSGDITDFGLTKEFRWVHRIMKNLPVPYFTAIGNHDLLANGGEVYERMYGAKNYFFDYGFARFICIDANGREYNFSGRVPDLNWLSQAFDLGTPPPMPVAQLFKQPIQQQITISHIPPFNNDFDPAVKKPFAELLGSNPQVNLSLHGHMHTWIGKEVYGDGVFYQVVTSQNKRAYALIKLWKDGYSIDKIEF